jgi:5-methylcytosine-specific restriction endonuclease McrA
MSQICTKCHRMLAFTHFHKNANRACGYSMWCKDCVKEHHRLTRSHNLAVKKVYRKAHAKTIHARNATWRAAHQEHLKAYRDNNPETHRQYRQKYVMSHREALRARARRYAQAHREARRLREAQRRARITQAPVNDLTAAQWDEIQRHYNYRCVYCGTKAQPLTMDHLTPLSRGGSHTRSNVVPACRPCNSKKGPRRPFTPVQPLLL